VRVLVLGGDGYLGWPVSMRLSLRCDVTVVDDFSRRSRHRRAGTRSLTPILSLADRTRAWREVTGQTIDTVEGDITAPGVVAGIIREVRPDSVIHLAAQPSRRWAEADVDQAVETMTVGVIGAVRLVWALRDDAPDAHLIRLGTTGEYGRPDIEIAEGTLDISHRGRRDRLPMPLLPGSVYDLTKAHESSTMQTAARLFGLRVTDIRQGAVYGAHTSETALDDRLATRLDYDGTFGTALNRFCVQAGCELPLTLTGDPSRAFPIVDIEDCVQAIELLTEHPPPPVLRELATSSARSAPPVCWRAWSLRVRRPPV